MWETEAKEKKAQNRTSTVRNIYSRSKIEQDFEIDLGTGHKEEQQLNAQLPTKVEMAAIFAALESSLKIEMATIHKNLGHVLTRVDDTEKRLDSHTQTIKEIKGEMKVLRTEQRELEYKLEDQENRHRRKNLRICGLPEPIQGEDLVEKNWKIFNPILVEKK